jgi:hypothetical protein
MSGCAIWQSTKRRTLRPLNTRRDQGGFGIDTGFPLNGTRSTTRNFTKPRNGQHIIHWSILWSYLHTHMSCTSRATSTRRADSLPASNQTLITYHHVKSVLNNVLMSTNDEERKPICILSFGMTFGRTWKLGATYLIHHADNGGPGTYSQLLILRESMARSANDLDVAEEDVYPADYFDLMGGVGFGG